MEDNMNKGKICWYSFEVIALQVFSLHFIELPERSSTFQLCYLLLMLAAIALIFLFSPRTKEENKEMHAWLQTTYVGRAANSVASVLRKITGKKEK